jgi:hypothetical protein
MRRDWIAGVVLLALAAGYYRMAVSIPRSQLSDVVGASSFPVLLSAALATLSVILILVGVFRKAPTVSAEESAKKAAGEVHGFVRAGGTLAIGVAFLMVGRRAPRGDGALSPRAVVREGRDHRRRGRHLLLADVQRAVRDPGAARPVAGAAPSLEGAPWETSSVRSLKS